MRIIPHVILSYFAYVTSSKCSWNNYPAPGRYQERGIVFARFSFFLSFFVSLSARLRENGWTDLREIFREGVE